MRFESDRYNFSRALRSCVLRAAQAATVLLFLCGLTAAVQSQAFRVIYSFTGGTDGSSLGNGLSIDPAGNLYGTTFSGGLFGCGTVFELTRTESDWSFSSLYSFSTVDDGCNPLAPVSMAPNGVLYGTTNGGGFDCSPDGRCGTVFALQPSSRFSAQLPTKWTERVIYRFHRTPDGHSPFQSPVTIDAQGNLYFTTELGGQYGPGAVIQLTPSNDGWMESVIYSFTDGSDGAEPLSGVILDKAGNLYGTAINGGSGATCAVYVGCGVVFQLAPSGPGWTEKAIFNFHHGTEGANPLARLVTDESGNLYGSTTWGGDYHHGEALGTGGSVFMLTPSNDGWIFTVLHSFAQIKNYYAYPGPDALVMDGEGNLYGARPVGAGAYNYGDVFKLTPGTVGWTYTSIHDFNGEDGYWPNGLIVHPNGKIYGTTWQGGAYGAGVVFEITP